MFFGMSVGTAVAVISYISRIFSPIESIGMEIQTIQEALAGAKRVGEFLELPTRLETSGEAGEKVMVELGRAGAASGSDYAAAAGSVALRPLVRIALRSLSRQNRLRSHAFPWKMSASAMKRKRWF